MGAGDREGVSMGEDMPRECDIELLEAAANFLRGMALDPSIPQHARQACISQAQQIDEHTAAAVALIEQYTPAP